MKNKLGLLFMLGTGFYSLGVVLGSVVYNPLSGKIFYVLLKNINTFIKIIYIFIIIVLGDYFYYLIFMS